MLKCSLNRTTHLFVALIVLGLGAASASGCGLFVRGEDDNGNGNGNGNGNDNGENGDEITIFDVRDPARRAALDSLEDLVLEDLIVTAVRSYTYQGDSRHDIFVQHPDGGPYSAIQLWSVPVSPDPGDVLRVTGTYDSYFGMDQLRAVTFEVTGTADVPEPEVFDEPADLATDGGASYTHQSVLVRVENVSVTEPRFPGSDGEWRGDFQVDGDLVVGPLFRHEYANPVEGDLFSSITGVLSFSFDESRLQPRFNEDMVFIDGTIPGPGEPVDVTIRDVRDPELRAEMGDGPFTVEGTVTARRPRGGRYDLWIQSANAGPWDGIMLHNADTDAEPGDLIEVTGSYDQYYGNDQLEDITAVTVLDSGGPVPEPLLVDPETIATASDDAFSYQSLLLRVADVAVTEFPIEGDEATWTGDFRVDGELVVGTYFQHDYDPELADEFQSIAGVLRHARGENRLEPRFNEDIIFEDGSSPGEEPDPDPTVVSIREVRDPELRAELGDGPFTVEGIVTARRPRHAQFDLWIQTADDPGPWDGILIYNAATIASPGDLIRVTGSYDQFAGMDQLRNVSVEVLDTPGLPDPIVVEPGLIETDSDEAFSYQALLLRVENTEGLEVTEFPIDGDHESREGDFRVNDGLVVSMYFAPDYEVDTDDRFESITGVLHHTYSEHRLAPRIDEDIVFDDGTSPPRE